MNKPADVSVIIPVLNEGGQIGELLRHVLERAGGMPVEIIVSDGDPERSTLACIDDEGTVKIASPKGRGIQMNRGAAHATGVILLFLHADTLLPSDAFKEIQDALANSRYVGGAFDLGIASDRSLMRLTARCASLNQGFSSIK